MKKAISLSLALAVFTGVSSVYLLPGVGYVVIAAVIAVTILIALGKINKRHYPIYIFGLSLSLLWQTSMLGIHIVGVDIHTEYFVANQTIANGWNLSWSNNSNTSIVLGLITPTLAKLGINPIWQFKAIFPLVCAFTPVILYYAFKRVIGENRSFFACLFFMTMPMFTMEVVSMVKSQWAYMFLASMVFFITSTYEPWKKALGITLSAAGTVFCHYAVGTIAIGYLIGMFGLLTITNWDGLRHLLGQDRLPLRYTGAVTICAIAIFCLYLGLLGGGSTLRTIFATGDSAITIVERVITSDNDKVTTEVTTPDLTGPQVEDFKEVTNPVASNTYLDSQAPLVRTAIGLDFWRVSRWGKVFRVFQYLSQLFLVIGFAIVLWKRGYGFTAEYTAGVIASFMLLGACVFIPFFTLALSPTRFYATTLFFVSPLLIIAIEQIGRRTIKWVR
ncbi:hypothetical protein ES704_01390 [subsurface metagenome]|jgi:uncharacterized membrane protein